MSLLSVVNRFNLTSILSPSKLLFPKIGANEIVATDPTNAVGGGKVLSNIFLQSSGQFFYTCFSLHIVEEVQI